MILHIFLFVLLGPLALVSCQSDSSDDSGDEKITPFTLNDLDSILASTDATLYPISGTCHEEEAVIALTVNDTFSNTCPTEKSNNIKFVKLRSKDWDQMK